MNDEEAARLRIMASDPMQQKSEEDEVLLQDDFDFGDMVSPFGHEKSDEGNTYMYTSGITEPQQNMGNLQGEVRSVEAPAEEVGLSWSMFEKVKELGEGSFGKVHLVKCNQNSVIKSDGSNILETVSA